MRLRLKGSTEVFRIIENTAYPERMGMLCRTCAWRNRHMGYKDGQGQTGVTHGLCIDCARKLEEER